MTTVLVFYRFITVTFYYDQNLFHLTALVLYIYQDIITKSAHLFFSCIPLAPSIRRAGTDGKGVHFDVRLLIFVCAWILWGLKSVDFNKNTH